MTVYCIVPTDLARKLHPSLREFYRHDRDVEVVIERRVGERRQRPRRRNGHIWTDSDRRHLRGADGLRLAERRRVAVPVPAPVLPRRARRHASELRFIELVMPTDAQVEDLDTDRLVAQFQTGDQLAFTEIYLRYFDRVYSYLRVAVRDAHEAEDLTQHVFTRVFEALPRYEIRHTHIFRAWLFTIARNLVVNHLERSRRIQPMDVEDIARRRVPEVQSEETVRWTLQWLSDSELLMFIERLPLTQRQVLTLRFLGGLSTTEIATVLDRTPESVRQLQSRALRFLSDRLVAIGRKPLETNRHANSPVLRQLRVIRRRRFALG